MQDRIYFFRDMNELSNVVFKELKPRITEQMFYVLNASSEEVVHHHNMAIPFEKQIRQM